MADDTQMTVEQEKAKWDELKAVGYTNLVGDDRALYSELKKKFKDADPDVNNPDAADVPAKSQASGESFTISGDTYCNGTHYEKGAVVTTDDANLETLKKEGLLN